MSNFPSGWFFIQSKCAHKMVIDVAMDSHKDSAKIVVWPKKEQNFDNQLWMYDSGYIINKNSGLVLDVLGGVLENDKQIIQYRRKMVEDAQNQRWYYREDGFLYPQVNPNLVLDIRGNWTKPGTVVLLYDRKFSDNENQLWDLIPHDPQGSNTPKDDDASDIDKDYSFSSSSYAL
ncbi:ricin B-like lectin [Lichtheimia hyalospora FSU 10163]|nr:ricin B-like lectin [Lichtheimia hyalospora FSU 10163]